MVCLSQPRIMQLPIKDGLWAEPEELTVGLQAAAQLGPSDPASEF